MSFYNALCLENLAFDTNEIACSNFTYGVLVPKEVEEGVEREVVVGAGEAREGSDDGTRNKHVIRVFLEALEPLFHLLHS